MSIYTLNPFQDPRWNRFLEQHPKASIFHSTGWLEALRRTYGYEPVVFTTAAPGEELHNGLIFCRIRSWLTGRRLVALPFSDHCEPLVDSREELDVLLRAVVEHAKQQKLKYVEFRPAAPWAESASSGGMLSHTETFYLHVVDLRPELKDVYRKFHKSCVQRKIEKAGRESLTCEAGRTEKLVSEFFELQLLTRRRHGIPPQPRSWFRNLADCLGDALTIRMAYKDGQPIASILTLRFKDTVYYKYGCSDARFNNLGGTPLLFWQTIQEAREGGACWFDLGRSEPDNTGLVQFKDHWNSVRTELNYYRYSPLPAGKAAPRWGANWARQALLKLPDPLFAAVGRFLYPHAG